MIDFKLKNDKKGIALIMALMLMTVILFMAIYFLNFSSSEKRISSSQAVGEQNYYLAESGIAEMIYRIKTDPTYRDSFQSDPTWKTSFTRTNPFGPNTGTYSVSVANSGIAYGDIVATGTLIVNGHTSQRVVKTRIYRLIGLSGMGTNAIVVGTSTLYVHNSNDVQITGDVYSNSGVKSNGNTIFTISGSLTTTQDIQGVVGVTGTTTQFAGPFLVPGVNFDDLRNQATTRLANDAALDATNTMSGIVWASTTVDIEDSKTINGLLVVNGNLTLKNSASLTITHSSGTPSGIMVNGNFTMTDDPKYHGDIEIDGIVYATGKILFQKQDHGHNFLVNGGIASGNGFEIDNCWGDMRINYNNDILVDSLHSTSTSPVIAIEHWEEEY